MKAVIFDLGNVLVGYDHQATLAALAAHTTVDAAAVQDAFAAVGAAAGIGQLDAAQLHAELAARTGYQGDFARFIADFATGIRPDATALAYAVALQERPGVTVAVMSNTNAAHVLWLDEHVPELKQIDLVMMSNEVGILKPSPAIYRLALELLDVPPAQAIFIDDLADNVAAAQALGLAGLVHEDWATTKPALEAWLAADA